MTRGGKRPDVHDAHKRRPGRPKGTHAPARYPVAVRGRLDAATGARLAEHCARLGVTESEAVREAVVAMLANSG